MTDELQAPGDPPGAFPCPPGLTVHAGDCLDLLRTMPDASVDAVVTDPPAGIAFMGKDWDRDKGGRDAWVAWLTSVMTEVRRVLKPGGHALVWALPRTSHWTATALEDAGLEIRDCVVHLFGSGFPKSLDIGKAIDKAAGAEREVVGRILSPAGNGKAGTVALGGAWQDAPVITAPATDDAKRWDGWGTALKPGQEHWWLVRKPLEGTVAANVLAHGVGGLNVDGCRIPMTDADREVVDKRSGADDGQRDGIYSDGLGLRAPGERFTSHTAGRWPANLVLTHSADCPEGGPCAGDCPVAELDGQSGWSKSPDKVVQGQSRAQQTGQMYSGRDQRNRREVPGHGDSGGASRFFPTFRYQAKAPARERPRLPDGTAWPTVKPLGLMRWLVRLITPPGGLVLDPFGGTGTTAEACALEGFRCVLIESDPTALELTRVRLDRLAS
ncbi:MAG TPA: DNA methyltransferase [Armatimonadota bacterium]|nr:DNA methyltransferase [Armatimonadota bacterium]